MEMRGDDKDECARLSSCSRRESMKRISVASSAIRSVGYDTVDRVLEVEFHTGEVFQYFPVPKETYHALLGAPSKGAFLDTRIKQHFIFRRVE